MNKTVCLCASFRFFKELTKVSRVLTKKGVICLTPKPFKFRDQEHPAYFCNMWDDLSHSDKLKVSQEAELDYLEKVDKADILYVINPSGYVGKSVLFEVGYAFAKGKVIFFQEPVQDFAIMGLVQRIATTEDVVKFIEAE